MALVQPTPSQGSCNSDFDNGLPSAPSEAEARLDAAWELLSVTDGCLDLAARLFWWTVERESRMETIREMLPEFSAYGHQRAALGLSVPGWLMLAPAAALEAFRAAYVSL